MRRLALFVVHRRWVVIVAALLFLPLAAIVGGNVQKQLTVGGMEDPGAESARTSVEIEQRFANAGQSDFVVLVTARHGDVDDPAVRAAGLDDHQAAGGRARHRRRVVVLGREPRPAEERRRHAGAGLRIGAGRPRRQGRGREEALGEVHDDERSADHRGHRPGRDRPPDQQAGRARPQAVRAAHRAVHLHRARHRVRRAGGRAAPAQRRGARGGRDPAHPDAPRVAHRGLGLRAEPHDRARPRARDRLQPVRRVPVPRGARDRRVDQRRGRPHHADRGPNGGVQRGDGDDLARLAAALPGHLPALVRVRRRRGRLPRRDLVGRSSCPRSSRCWGRAWSRCASSSRSRRRTTGFWGRQAGPGDEAPRPVRGRRERGARSCSRSRSSTSTPA